MKQLSIRARLTLWLTIIMTVMVTGVMTILIYVSDTYTHSVSQNNLISVVDNAVEKFDFKDGQPDTEDIDFFENGVYLTVFSSDGSMFYGNLPNGFDASAPLSDKKVAKIATADTGNYYYYDEVKNYTDFGDIHFRAVVSESALNESYKIIFYATIIGLPVMLILSAIIGYMFVNKALSPIRKIADTASSIGSSTDLSQRIGLTGHQNDELYKLSKTFDDMLDKLEQAFNREKQFTSDVSHELRTPTAVILSQCAYSLENAQNEDEYRQALETIEKKAVGMSGLISQLLSLSRSDGEKSQLNIETVNISELAQMVADDISEKAETINKGITINCNCGDNILLKCDQTMIMRMMINLFDNSVKYGKQGGETDITVEDCNDGNVKIQVHDNGIGISDEDKGKIFDRFYQGDKARSSSDSGVGLGLSMVKHIVSLHGGNIDLESQLNRGSTFTVKIPKGHI